MRCNKGNDEFFGKNNEKNVYLMEAFGKNTQNKEERKLRGDMKRNKREINFFPI